MIKVKNTDGTWSTVTGAGGSASIIEKTYSALKTLKDTDKLVKGQLYRITDYVATTSQSNTQSANHPFDIIVQAISTNTLSEDAMACLHTGKTYFSSCDLSAWSIKYCFDVNSVYTWANLSPTLAAITVEDTVYTRDSSMDKVFINDAGGSSSDLYVKGFTTEDETSVYTAGLGEEISETIEVQYEVTSEEYINLVSYSEDTDTFSCDDGTTIHYTGEISDCGGRTYYRLEGVNGEYTIRAHTLTKKADAITTVKGGSTVATVRLAPTITDTKEIQAKTLKDNEDYRGVIYYMKDEFNNEAGFDFKGIQINSMYLFGGSTDSSITGKAHNNVVSPWYDSSTKKFVLKTASLPESAYNNTLNNCGSIVIVDGTCYNNTFINCDSVAMLSATCYNNVFTNVTNLTMSGNMTSSSITNSSYVVADTGATITNSSIENSQGTSESIIEITETGNLLESKISNSRSVTISGNLAKSSIENSGDVNIGSVNVGTSRISNCPYGITINGVLSNTTIENCFTIEVTNGCSLSRTSIFDSCYIYLGTTDATAAAYKILSISACEQLAIRSTTTFREMTFSSCQYCTLDANCVLNYSVVNATKNLTLTGSGSTYVVHPGNYGSLTATLNSTNTYTKEILFNNTGLVQRTMS